MKPFEIFRPGTHTASNGSTLTFADADLTALAGSYDPKLHHAPIVVGHPKQDAPAYGWIDSLSVKDGRLVATPADIDPAFADLVKNRRFGKVSAAFYSPTSANNPAPGAYYLRHVGFLGAAAPAVKGLKAIEFAQVDDDSLIVEVEFSDSYGSVMQTSWAFDAIGRLFRRLRDQVIATDGIDAADQAMPDYEIETLSRTANDLRTSIQVEDKPMNAYTENEDNMKTAAELEAERVAAIAAREAEITRREAEFSEQQSAAAAQLASARALEDAAFVDQQVTEGRLPMGLKGLATALFSSLTETEITFSDGAEDKTANPRLALRGLLSQLPMPVKAGEVIVDAGPDFSDAESVAEAIKTEISDEKAKGNNISAAEASMRITSRSNK